MGSLPLAVLLKSTLLMAEAAIPSTKIRLTSDSLNANIADYMARINIGDSIRIVSGRPEITAVGDEDHSGINPGLSPGQFERIEEEHEAISFANLAVLPQSTWSLAPSEPLRSLTSRVSEWTLTSGDSVHSTNSEPDDSPLRKRQASHSSLMSDKKSPKLVLRQTSPPLEDLPSTTASNLTHKHSSQPKPYVENQQFAVEGNGGLEKPGVSQVPEGGENSSLPSWMPPGLKEGWLEPRGEEDTERAPTVNQARTSVLETVVHALEMAETPNWKRLANQLEEQKRSQPMPLLKLIFLPVESSKSTKDQSQSPLETLNEPEVRSTLNTARITPSPEPNPATPSGQKSPLKLYGNRYNTFTKDKLSSLLENLRSNPSAISKNDREALVNALNLQETDDIPVSTTDLPSSPSPKRHSLRHLQGHFQAHPEAIDQPPFALTSTPMPPPVDRAGFYGLTPAENQKGLGYDIGIPMASVRRKGEPLREALVERSLSLAPPSASDTWEEGLRQGLGGDHQSSRTISYAHPLEEGYTSDEYELAQSTHLGAHDFPSTHETELDSFGSVSDSSMGNLTGEVSRIQTPHIKRPSLTVRGNPRALQFPRVSSTTVPFTPVKIDSAGHDRALEGNVSILKPESRMGRMSDPNASRMEVSFAIPEGDSDSEGMLPPIPPRRASTKPSLLNFSAATVSTKGHTESLGVDRGVELRTKGYGAGNVTLLSQLDEVTFSQTRRTLVHTITECLSHIPDFEKLNWNLIEAIDMREQTLESVKDLAKFLPLVKHLGLSHNHIRFLQGVPTKVLTLDALHNQIENITPFDAFCDLQSLKLDHNRLVRLNNIQHLIHLRLLEVSHNQIKEIDGLRDLSNLVSVDLSHNRLGEVDFSGFNLHAVQVLRLQGNQIRTFRGLGDLPEMRSLNLDENRLSVFGLEAPSNQLKKLSVRYNRLRQLNLVAFPALRVLRVDGNRLRSLGEGKQGMSHPRLRHIEEISAKCQHPELLHALLLYKDVARLDLSGNVSDTRANPAGFDVARLPRKCYFNVTALNLSALNLTCLPATFNDQFPNVRVLNLNYNQLTELGPLVQCQRLARVYLVSNALALCEPLVFALQGSRKTLRVLDMRLNPVNSGYYPYVFNPQEDPTGGRPFSADRSTSPPSALLTTDEIESMSVRYTAMMKPEGRQEWSERDLEYSRVLRQKNRETWSKRQAYEMLFVNLLHGLQSFNATPVDAARRDRLVQQFGIRDR